MILGIEHSTVPWLDIVYVMATVLAAFGAFVAAPMFFFFMKDRQKILLRQEVTDEQRRRIQVEEMLAERTKERDALRESLSDERKKPNVESLALTLAGIADTGLKTLDKLSQLNGGLGHAVDRLDASTKAMEAQTEAVKFIASRLVVDTDP